VTLRHIAWVNVASAIGITAMAPVIVEAYDVSAWFYVVIPLVWIAEAWLVPFLLKVDGVNRARGVDA
jgi:hypothetical protein